MLAFDSSGWWSNGALALALLNPHSNNKIAFNEIENNATGCVSLCVVSGMPSNLIIPHKQTLTKPFFMYSLWRSFPCWYVLWPVRECDVILKRMKKWSIRPSSSSIAVACASWIAWHFFTISVMVQYMLLKWWTWTKNTHTIKCHVFRGRNIVNEKKKINRNKNNKT